MRTTFSRATIREIPRAIGVSLLGLVLAAVCGAAELGIADPSAAPATADAARPADPSPSQPAERPFQASLLLLKNDWSKSAKAAEIDAQMRQVLAEATVPKELLDALPASGPNVLFPEEIVSFYDAARFRELLEWLKVNDLVKDTIAFPAATLTAPPGLRAPSAGAPPSYVSASLTKDYEFFGLEASSEIRNQPFIERTMHVRWTVSQRDNYFYVEGQRIALEKNRGEPTGREIPIPDGRACLFPLVEGKTAIVDPFLASSLQLRGYRREKSVALIVIEPTPAEIPPAPAKALLHLPGCFTFPDRVEQPRIVNSLFSQGERRGASRSRTAATTTAQGEQAIRIFALQYVRAESLATTLRQLFPDKLLVAVPDDRNQLMVRGTESQLEEVSAILIRLDQPVERPANVPGSAANPDSNLRSGPALPSSAADTGPSKQAWQEQYEARENVAADLARRCRELATKAEASPEDAKQLQALRDQLRTAVTEAFAARQQLHRAEMAEFQQRMARIQQTLEMRDRIQDQIIDRRVEDLVNPNLQWESDSTGEPSGPIRAPGMPGSWPVGATPASGQPNQAAPTQPPLPATSASVPVGNIPADVGGLLRSATEYRGKFRQLHGRIDQLQSLVATRTRQEDEFNNYTGNLAKSRHDLAALRDEFGTQLRLLELNLADAKQALDAAVRKRDMAKILHERGIAPVSELADADRAVEAAQNALERAQTVLDLYRKIELPPDIEEPNPADPSSSTQVAPPLEGARLSDAVHQFNVRNAEQPQSKDQPPLTDDEVVAAIRWATMHREKLPLSSAEFAALNNIAGLRLMLKGWDLQLTTDVPYNPTERFETWIVRLALDREGADDYTLTIRERVLRWHQELPSSSAVTADPNATPLAAAIKAFNERYSSHPIGKEQPSLSEDEVVAAIRWWGTKRNDAPVTEAEFQEFQKIADTRMLPEKAEFELLTSFRPTDQLEFDAWSVRIRMPGGRGTYAYVIRDRWIRLRSLNQQEIAWGSLGKNGIQVGVLFQPRNEVYAVGQRVVPRFFYRNVGQQDLEANFPNVMTHSYYDKLLAVDATGAPIPVDLDPSPAGPVGWMKIGFPRGAVHELSGLAIAIGDVPRDPSVETVIRTQPGQSCRVHFTLPNCADADSEPLPTGDIEFTMSAS